MEVGMDNYLWDMTAMEAILLDAFQNDKLGDAVHITDTIFESLKFASTTPLFRHGGKSKSTHSGTMMFLYNVKEIFGIWNPCFSAILR